MISLHLSPYRDINGYIVTDQLLYGQMEHCWHSDLHPVLCNHIMSRDIGRCKEIYSQGEEMLNFIYFRVRAGHNLIFNKIWRSPLSTDLHLKVA
ncbi:hypothetical protein GDO81_008590 [Engystomops pustulosus]|uniref:Uncharacterized protein n=1 Tax=Engystomops pustulosus TaxID=76066 RepID=A0AAV7CFT6_ENGPU|nr:hypothetical protein GDO81_008590 [Engystomops pustulosus]